MYLSLIFIQRIAILLRFFHFYHLCSLLIPPEFRTALTFKFGEFTRQEWHFLPEPASFFAAGAGDEIFSILPKCENGKGDNFRLAFVHCLGCFFEHVGDLFRQAEAGFFIFIVFFHNFCPSCR